MNLSLFHFSEPVGFGNDLPRVQTDADTGTGTARLRTVIDLASAWGG